MEDEALSCKLQILNLLHYALDAAAGRFVEDEELYEFITRMSQEIRKLKGGRGIVNPDNIHVVCSEKDE
jgi:hypothetical protein